MRMESPCPMFSTLTVIEPSALCPAEDVGADDPMQPPRSGVQRNTSAATAEVIHCLICTAAPPFEDYERRARLIRKAMDTRYIIQLTFLYCPAKSFMIV